MRWFPGLLVVGLGAGCGDNAGAEELFDGRSLAGWTANENPESWSVVDGLLVAHGARSHLFYIGDAMPFVDFELEAEVMTAPASNSGIYFHTRYQDVDFPRVGFECQIANTYPDPVRTGSLIGLVTVTEQLVPDDTWFTVVVRLEGKRITITVDGQQTVDYTEPEGRLPDPDVTRVIDRGTFALQAHDPGSTVRFRSIRIRRL